METTKIQVITKKNNKVMLITSLIVWTLLLIIWVWAGLTKAWYIPNYFNIAILCQWEKTDPCVNVKDTTICEQGSSFDWGGFNKPVIYLYPLQKTDISVKLDFNWKITADYPKYNKEIGWWKVRAYPDGTIINKEDSKKYSYLFWEWKSKNNIKWNLSKWFVVKWKDTRKFLQKTLSKMWLTPREYNEFIVYWYPLMKDNPYNLIHFAGKQYTNTAPLTITPKPNSMLRVFMVFKALDNRIDIEQQKIKPFERYWFTVIEWWGTEIR